MERQNVFFAPEKLLFYAFLHTTLNIVAPFRRARFAVPFVAFHRRAVVHQIMPSPIELRFFSTTDSVLQSVVSLHGAKPHGMMNKM